MANYQLKQLLEFYESIRTRFGNFSRKDYLASYNVFGSWVKGCMHLEPMHKKIKGVYFGIFEADDKSLVVYISGSKKWRAGDAEWATRNDYWPKGKYCPDLPVLEACSRLMQENPYKGADFATEIIIAYVVTYCHSYLDSDLNRENLHIAVGYDDGDLINI